MTTKLDLDEFGLSGLNNRGNTCFLNTTIQCLSNVIPLTDYMMKNEFMGPLRQESKKVELQTKYNREFEITKNYIQLIKVMWSCKEPIDPRSFHIAFQRFNNRFAGYNEQDSEEALTVILDSIHEVLSYPIEVSITGQEESGLDSLMVESYKAWKDSNEKKYSIITEIFTGQFVNQIISREVNNRNAILSRTYEKFDRINLPINGNSLYECLYNYFNVEVLGDKYHDEKRDLKVEAGRQIKLMILPKYLIIILKRFQRMRNGFMKKTTQVSFPINDLDLSNHVVGYDRQSSMYKLRSIGCHMGQIERGHYYSICRHRSDKWIMYNDKHSEEYNIRSEIPILQQRAYMLIYERNV